MMPSQRYKKWWEGKHCRTNPLQPFKYVKDVEFIGPPSEFNGIVVLHYGDGTSDTVMPCNANAYKPRKSDVEVELEHSDVEDGYLGICENCHKETTVRKVEAYGAFGSAMRGFYNICFDCFKQRVTFKGRDGRTYKAPTS